MKFGEQLTIPGCEPLEQAHARRTDPETSHQAAAALSSDSLRASQAEVLRLLRQYGPLTDVDLCEWAEQLSIPQSDSGLRTRRKELVVKGLVRDSGKRQTINGRKHILWQACA